MFREIVLKSNTFLSKFMQKQRHWPGPAAALTHAHTHTHTELPNKSMFSKTFLKHQNSCAG